MWDPCVVCGLLTQLAGQGGSHRHFYCVAEQPEPWGFPQWGRSSLGAVPFRWGLTAAIWCLALGLLEGVGGLPTLLMGWGGKERDEEKNEEKVPIWQQES